MDNNEDLTKTLKLIWLGVWFVDLTFEEEVDCDILEIRQLIDGDTLNNTEYTTVKKDEVQDGKKI